MAVNNNFFIIFQFFRFGDGLTSKLRAPPAYKLQK